MFTLHKLKSNCLGKCYIKWQTWYVINLSSSLISMQDHGMKRAHNITGLQIPWRKTYPALSLVEKIVNVRAICHISVEPKSLYYIDVNIPSAGMRLRLLKCTAPRGHTVERVLRIIYSSRYGSLWPLDMLNSLDMTSTCQMQISKYTSYFKYQIYKKD